MATKISKVTVEYIGGWSAMGVHEYRIAKIAGRPTVTVTGPLPAPTHHLAMTPEPAGPVIVRIGDVISEAQANEIADNALNELITLPKSDR